MELKSFRKLQKIVGTIRMETRELEDQCKQLSTMTTARRADLDNHVKNVTVEFVAQEHRAFQVWLNTIRYLFFEKQSPDRRSSRMAALGALIHWLIRPGTIIVPRIQPLSSSTKEWRRAARVKFGSGLTIQTERSRRSFL